MTSRYSPYTSFRPSGAAWLGDIPDHWDVKRVGLLYSESNARAFSDAEKEYPILSVSIHDGISDKEMSDTELDRKVTRSEDRSLYKVVRKNDLTYNMMRAWQGGFGSARVSGLVSPAYVVCRPRLDTRSKYYELVLRTPNAIAELKRYSRGITDFRLRLYWEDFKTIPVPVPPENEQRLIEAFLDHETAKIDWLIAKQERLIELLKEKRQAVISHAVTKGLNPDAPMKDSGVEWLGDVPAHWKVAKVGHHYEVVLGKMLDEKRITGEHSAPYLRNTDVQWDRVNTDDLPTMDFSPADRKKFELRKDDLLVCEGGEVGRAALWKGELLECYYQKALHRLRPLKADADLPRFMFYLLWQASEQGRFAGPAGKATIAHLPAETFRQYRFPFPPGDEQEEIVSFLDDKNAKMDLLVKKARRSIELMQEHRAALISAAVTGKIDVRGWQKPSNQPQEAATAANA